MPHVEELLGTRRPWVALMWRCAQLLPCLPCCMEGRAGDRRGRAARKESWRVMAQLPGVPGLFWVRQFC